MHETGIFGSVKAFTVVVCVYNLYLSLSSTLKPLLKTWTVRAVGGRCGGVDVGVGLGGLWGGWCEG